MPNKKIFDGVTHILSCIPPDKNGNDPVLESLKNKLQDLSLEWVGYLSTTGIYGNTEGGWVSELDQPNPLQKRIRYFQEFMLLISQMQLSIFYKIKTL